MVVRPPDEWDRSTDVVVIGSGTGMAAALAASHNGADVLVLEKAPKLGGTTAVSAGGAWVPNSEPVVESIGETPKEDLMEYLREATEGRTSEERLRRFLDEAPRAHKFIEEETALTFHHVRHFTDYYMQLGVGGHEHGHQISPNLYDGDRLGDNLDDIRKSPYYPDPILFNEMQDHEEYGPYTVFGRRVDEEFEREIERRKKNNQLAMGQALIAGMYEALLERGVSVEMNAPAEDLIMSDSKVVGVVADIDGEELHIGADAVIIAAGGMDWDQDMKERFLRAPAEHPGSPPQLEGDGIVMGADAGAKLGNMDQAWWFPIIEMPGVTWEDGSQVYNLCMDRALPGAIVVNEDGERFGNESMNYHEFAKLFHHFDPHEHEYKNVPAYVICDGEFRDRYDIGGLVSPDDEIPDWVTEAESLTELADKLEIDATGLESTVDRFNSHARDGEDPEFGRGEDPYDRHHGDPSAEHPNLAPLEEAPYFAYELLPGSLGTKGGMVINPDSEVLNHDDEKIPGLYASANDTAHLMGPAYVGGGATIGPNLTFGVIAGENAAEYATERSSSIKIDSDI